MAYNAEPYAYTSRKRDESDFNVREWTMKARISRENNNNINSRRYSASYMRSFREDTRSHRSNITISSTASSPGYPFKGTFLFPLQFKTIYIYFLNFIPPESSATGWCAVYVSVLNLKVQSSSHTNKKVLEFHYFNFLYISNSTFFFSDEIDPSTYSFTTALKGNHIVN
jgi:hypothetical protein